MQVLFAYSTDFKKIQAVIWQDETGINERTLMSNGTTRDKQLNFTSLSEVHQQLGRAMYPMYPAEVDDIRLAFKYLGKASDLVELLPEADLDGQPDLTAP